MRRKYNYLPIGIKELTESSIQHFHLGARFFSLRVYASVYLFRRYRTCAHDRILHLIIYVQRVIKNNIYYGKAIEF